LCGPITAALAVALGLAAAALLLAAWGFTTDDAWIPLRYARHLVAGDGLRWNAGEPPVEGYSNFTFVLVGALALAAGSEPVFWLKLLGALSLLAVLALLPALQEGRGRLPLALAAGFVFLFHPWVPLWSISGLETATYALLALGAIALAGRGAERFGQRDAASARRWLVASGAAVLLAALTRPEGPLVGLAIAAGAAAEGWRQAGGRAGWRRAAALVAPVALVAAPLWLLYLGWKLAWFGDWLPNSVRCKAIWEGDPWLLLREALPLVGWTLPLAACAVLARRSLRRVALATFALASLAILHGVDPIVGYGNRHVLAAWAALVSLAVAGAADLAERLWPRPGRQRVAVALLTGTALLCLAVLAPRLRFARHTGAAYESRDAARRELVAWLDARHDASARVVLGDCGLVGFLTRTRVIDALCLNAKETPRPPIRRDPEAFARWVFGGPPEVVVLSSTRADRLALRGAYGVYPALARHPAFAAYRLGAIFGHADDELFYWVFERERPGAGGDSGRPADDAARAASSLRVTPVRARAAVSPGAIQSAAAAVSATSSGSHSAS
jgi:hypothetical protein